MRRLAKEMDPNDEEGGGVSGGAGGGGSGGVLSANGVGSVSSSGNSGNSGFGQPMGVWPVEGGTGPSPLNHAMLSSMLPSNTEHLNRAYGQIKDMLAMKVHAPCVHVFYT